MKGLGCVCSKRSLYRVYLFLRLWLTVTDSSPRPQVLPSPEVQGRNGPEGESEQGFRDGFWLKQLSPIFPYLIILFIPSSGSVSSGITGFAIFPFQVSFHTGNLFVAYHFLVVTYPMQAIKVNSWYQCFVFLLLHWNQDFSSSILAGGNVFRATCYAFQGFR